MRPTQPTLNKAGSVTFISAVSAQIAAPGVAGIGAINGMLLTVAPILAVELKPLRVNVVAPGVIESSGFAAYSPEARAKFSRGNPMLRHGNVQDIANAVVYLTGPSGEFVNGELLNVDGGGILWGELWTIPKPAYFSAEETA